MAEELYKLEKERENVMVKIIIIDAVNVWLSVGRLLGETISLAFLILGRCTRLYFSQIWSVLFPSVVRTRWRVRASVGPEVGGRGGGGVWVFLLIIWYQCSCIDKIVYYHSTFWFCSWGRPGGRGGGSAGWFRSNFRPPCQKLLDPVLFLFVVI